MTRGCPLHTDELDVEGCEDCEAEFQAGKKQVDALGNVLSDLLARVSRHGVTLPLEQIVLRTRVETLVEVLLGTETRKRLGYEKKVLRHLITEAERVVEQVEQSLLVPDKTLLDKHGNPVKARR